MRSATRIGAVTLCAAALVAGLALLRTPSRDGAAGPRAMVLAPDAGAPERGGSASVLSGDAESAGGTRIDVAPTAREFLAPEAVPEAPAFEWTGLVRERASGAPIAGAEVRLFDGEREARAETDAGGRFRVEWRGELPRDASAEARAPGRTPARRPHVPLAEEALFELERSATLSVRLTGLDARSLAAARVEVFELRRGSAGRRDPIDAVAVAADRFEFELEPGEYALAALAPERAMRTEARVLLAAGERRALALELARGGTLRGRVRTKALGAWIAGARVEVRSERQGASREIEERGERVAITGPDGSFRVDGLAPGPNRVELRAPWGGRVVERVEVGASGDLVERDFVLPESAALEGRVLDASGVPVAGAWVVASWAGNDRALGVWDALDERGRSPERSERARAQCDALGVFRFANLPARTELRLLATDARVAADADCAFAHGLKLGAGEDRRGFELALHRSPHVSGLVQSADGAPLAGARVRATLQDGETRLRAAETRSDAEGRFELACAAPGSYEIEARLDGYESGRSPAELFEGARFQLDFALERAPTIEGTVLDRDGYAIPYARLRAKPLAGEGEKERDARTTTAGSDGRFRFDHVAPDDYEVGARALGFAGGSARVHVVRGEEASPLALVLEPTAPSAYATVLGEVRVEGGGTPDRLRFDGLRGGAVTLEGGRFRIDGVRPGRMVLVVKAEGAADRRLPSVQLESGDELDLGTLALEAGTRLAVTLRDAEERAVRKARVQVIELAAEKGRRGARVRLAEKSPGRYVAEGVPLASFRLAVDRDGFAPLRKKLEVSERPSQAARFVLEGAR